ncbi:MAG: hypothetical protein ABEJ83_00315, partial [Candidatus Nanohaloarchaea archaeon]
EKDVHGFVPDEDQATDEEINRIFEDSDSSRPQESFIDDETPEMDLEQPSGSGSESARDVLVSEDEIPDPPESAALLNSSDPQKTIEQFLESERGDLGVLQFENLYSVLERLDGRNVVVEIYGAPPHQKFPELVEEEEDIDINSLTTLSENRRWRKYGNHYESRDLTETGMNIIDLIKSTVRSTNVEILQQGIKDVGDRPEQLRKQYLDISTMESFEEYAGEPAALEDVLEFLRQREGDIEAWEEDLYEKLVEAGYASEMIRVVHTADDIFQRNGEATAREYLQKTENYYGPLADTIALINEDKYGDKITGATRISLE